MVMMKHDFQVEGEKRERAQKTHPELGRVRVVRNGHEDVDVVRGALALELRLDLDEKLDA